MIQVTPSRRHERRSLPFGGQPSTRVFIKFSDARRPDAFQPNINAYQLADRFEICVDLAGVEAESLDLAVDRNRLYIRGIRETPKPERQRGEGMGVLAMEIDHGPFQRIVELPAEVDPEGVTADQHNGLLWIRLPLLLG